MTNPVSGEMQEVAPDMAAQLLQTGWVPAGEQSAEASRAAQIPMEVAAAQPSGAKFQYGVLRGAASPLIDLALPAGGRVHEILSQDSPWLVGGGEAAGMLGTLALGVGPAAALERAGAKAAASLGAGNGIVRSVFGRAAQGAIETGGYGVMDAISHAHEQNVPLTAQRLGSEILPGLLFGAVGGGLLGGVEGGLSRFGKTLPDRLREVNQSKLDEIFAPGVSDADGLRMARELGVPDAGAMERFQAMASGGDVTPERLALLKDSGAVGARARQDAFASGDQLAEAERHIVDKGNDYLLGREEALKQLNGNIKQKHIAAMIGAGNADAADIGKLVRDAVVDEGDWAANVAKRNKFIDDVMDAVGPEGARDLERSLGVRTADSTVPDLAKAGKVTNLRERLLSGLDNGQNETIDAIQDVLGKAKLTDDSLLNFGVQGSWNAKPMEFIARAREKLGALASLPKGVNEHPGWVEKMLGNLDHAEQSLLRDPRRMAAHELDSLKKNLARFAEPGERLGAGSGVPFAAREMYEDLRLMLEDPVVWGPKFAGFQSRVNSLVHKNMGVMGEFDDLFVKEIGLPDPDSKGWRNARVVDSGKVSKAVAEMSEPKQLEQLERIRNHLDDQKKFFKEMLDTGEMGQQAHVRIQAGIKQLDQLREAIDKGVYLNTAQRQAKALLGFGPLGSGWEARAALGAVVGGPLGAAAGLGLSAALNPGKMLQFRAISERMAEQTGSRVWRGISKLLGLKVGDVAGKAAGFVGRTAGKAQNAPGRTGVIINHLLSERGDERARTYERTVQQLIEARGKLPQLQSQLDERMPVLEQALPGAKGQMLAQASRGLDYAIAHLPVQVQQRAYGTRAAPLSDADYESFLRTTMAAVDPPSILEMAEDGELTPAAVKAAEYSAPEFVEYIKGEMMRAMADVGPDKVPYENRISASLMIGTPLDESLEPENIDIQQATHRARQEAYAKRKESRGGGGETGVNNKYASESDRLESGQAPT